MPSNDAFLGCYLLLTSVSATLNLRMLLKLSILFFDNFYLKNVYFNCQCETTIRLPFKILEKSRFPRVAILSLLNVLMIL